MSTPCFTCQQINCVNPPDFQTYSLESAAFFSPLFTFVVPCPTGFNCAPGTFPRIITIPAGQFIIPGPIPPAGLASFPVQLQCCQSTVFGTIPAGSTQAQINTIIMGLFQQCAAQQAICNAIVQTPPPVLQSAIPFVNNAQSILVCPSGQVPTFSPALPANFILVNNTLNIVAGSVNSFISQADADSKAIAALNALVPTATCALPCFVPALSTLISDSTAFTLDFQALAFRDTGIPLIAFGRNTTAPNFTGSLLIKAINGAVPDVTVSFGNNFSVQAGAYCTTNNRFYFAINNINASTVKLAKINPDTGNIDAQITLNSKMLDSQQAIFVSGNGFIYLNSIQGITIYNTNTDSVVAFIDPLNLVITNFSINNFQGQCTVVTSTSEIWITVNANNNNTFFDSAFMAVYNSTTGAFKSTFQLPQFSATTNTDGGSSTYCPINDSVYVYTERAGDVPHYYAINPHTQTIVADMTTTLFNGIRTFGVFDPTRNLILVGSSTGSKIMSVCPAQNVIAGYRITSSNPLAFAYSGFSAATYVGLGAVGVQELV